MPSTATPTHVVTVPLLVSMSEMDGRPWQSAEIAFDLITKDLTAGHFAGQFTIDAFSATETIPGCHQVSLSVTVTMSEMDGSREQSAEIAADLLHQDLNNGHFKDTVAVGGETSAVVLEHCTVLPRRYHAQNGVVWKIAVLNSHVEPLPPYSDTVDGIKVLSQQTKARAYRRTQQRHREHEHLAEKDLCAWTTARGAKDITIGCGGPHELAPASFVALSSTAPGVAFVDRVLLVTQDGEADARRLGLMGETPDAA